MKLDGPDETAAKGSSKTAVLGFPCRCHQLSDPVAFVTLSRAVCTFDMSMARAVDLSKGVRHDAGVIDIGHHQMLADAKCGNRRRPSSEDHFVLAD